MVKETAVWIAKGVACVVIGLYVKELAFDPLVAKIKEWKNKPSTK